MRDTGVKEEWEGGFYRKEMDALVPREKKQPEKEMQERRKV